MRPRFTYSQEKLLALAAIGESAIIRRLQIQRAKEYDRGILNAVSLADSDTPVSQVRNSADRGMFTEINQETIELAVTPRIVRSFA